MTVELLVFLILSALTLGGGMLVVTTRNLFHAGLYLMISLFGVAGLFVLLTAPFLGVVQVIVYIGAIAILIMLAIMLSPNITNLPNPFTAQWPVGAALAVIFFVMLITVVTPVMNELGADDWVNSDQLTVDTAGDVPADGIATLGEELVDPHKYMLPFEVASVLLMAAMIGAVLLVHPGKQAEDVIEDVA
ncbi:MAG: NADH-quinone oxidoreductase subunit J [Anaerolineae bacterium]|nr:NADH-quinone oxidoreductase subunit J [Anaerolineae bacterium]